MKRLIFKTVFLPAIPVMALLLAVISCNDSNKEVPHDPNQRIVLTTFEPDSGRIRDMVLLNGDNFGTDISAIKVFFNSSEAKVVGSTGTRLLVRVPRLPGDNCIVSVQIGSQRREYLHEFRYQVSSSVTTIAGNDEPTDDGNAPIWENGLDNSRLTPVYMGIDRENNLFVSVRPGYLFRINVRENTITLVATEAQHGYEQRCLPYVNPLTNVIQLGSEAIDGRDKFMFMDPKEGWAPKINYIRTWNWHNFLIPQGRDNVAHYNCVLNEADGHYYTRYGTGLIARINPETWHAEAIGMTPSGRVMSMVFHPENKNQLWMGYWEESTAGYNNAICYVDVSDTTCLWGDTPIRGLMTTFRRASSPISAAGHRDGPLNLAQFSAIRQINFD